MVNHPFPVNLKSEAKKAAKILGDFSIPNAKAGPDKIIPAGVITSARGLAILTVAKLGFLITARGGSGIVIAKLEDDTWSAPSAIGIAGLGGGLEIGAEVTDFVIILNKQSAVDAFSKGGNLTLGGNFTIAAGPIGRNIEGDVSLRSPAAIYTYSKTKGIFAGISIEGSALIERKDANKKFYNEPVRAYEILGGAVKPPAECAELYDVLSKHEDMFQRAALAYAKRRAISEGKKYAEKQGFGSSVAFIESRKSSFKNSEGGKVKIKESRKVVSRVTRSQSFAGSTESSMSTPRGAMAPSTSFGSQLHVGEHAIATTSSAWDNPTVARATWGFEGLMPCDLSFKTGDEIIVLTQTGTQDDWWEGSFEGKIGIFPANYVEVISQ